MPQWAWDAAQPGPVALLDVVLEICRAFPAYTVDAALDTPVRRFWLMVENVRRHNQERAAALGHNPMGALALMTNGDR